MRLSDVFSRVASCFAASAAVPDVEFQDGMDCAVNGYGMNVNLANHSPRFVQGYEAGLRRLIGVTPFSAQGV